MISYIQYIFRALFSKDCHYYRLIKRLFGVRADNIELYKLALIHKSASCKLEDGSLLNNERLEFLGDAVIEAVVSDMIFIEYPKGDEGFLTQLRSKIVSRSSLNHVAEKIGLVEHIITQSHLPTNNKHMAGDAFEAMIGAIYLDKGYDYTNRLLINNLFSRYVDIETINETESDFKSRLIEWCQKHRIKAQIKTTQSQMFTEQHTQFQCEITVNKHCCYGIGDSKKEAEQRASKNMLHKLTKPEKPNKNLAKDKAE
ncbi:MAG: ribonuclease III [Rikenellaceae bacterium]